MQLRKSSKEDVKDIMNIIKEAQEYFKASGIDQWQDNYPNEEVINNDINNGESYVLIENDKIVATTVISFRGEKTYEKIYDGSWITNDSYGVIHRIAIKSSLKGRGVSNIIINTAKEYCLKKGIHSLKVDTHEDNKSMQRFLLKNDFKYCGIIYLVSGAKRVAFEKNF